jgi:hypothetical protein
LGILLLTFIVLPGLALAQTSFFQGKTITIIQGRDPGGTGDMRVKSMLPFLQKYIPGNSCRNIFREIRLLLASLCRRWKPQGSKSRLQISPP